jgi:uncharacterized protein YcsI (UPF0317 family)
MIIYCGELKFQNGGIDMKNIMSPKEMRELIRKGEYKNHTSGTCHGFVQGNVVILEQKYAYDFLLFCVRNKKACPILDVTDIGDFEFKKFAKESDIRFDVPKYYIYKNGVLDSEVTSVEDIYGNDFVAFLLGCSFTFEFALLDGGISLKHMDRGLNVAMYDTNIKNDKSGIFSGNMVVSMRPIKKTEVEKVIEITGKYPDVHGSPIHVGTPEDIGIKNIEKPDYGDFVEIDDDEVPVFWPCGVTSQNAVKNAKIPLVITHSPGHMFITDVKNQDLKVK